MKQISIENLVDLKVLPFDVYDNQGETVLSKGSAVSPGKLLQLRYLPAIFIKDVTSDNSQTDSDVDIEETSEQYEYSDFEIEDEISSDNLIDNDPLEGIVNSKSTLPENIQIDLKTFYKDTLSKLNTKINSESIDQVKHMRDKILNAIFPIVDKTYRKSQLKIIGSYEKYHGLNVALLSVMLSKKMGLTDSQSADIALGALLHDIGKARLPEESQDFFSHNSSSRLYKLHPELGYKILKNELKLPGSVCAIALEHHEKNDGTGYPLGISMDQINPYSQIVAICNMYDNLISRKTNVLVATPQQAVRKILEFGTECFAPGVLFSFVYMTNYSDDMPLEELGIIETW